MEFTFKDFISFAAIDLNGNITSLSDGRVAEYATNITVPISVTIAPTRTIIIGDVNGDGDITNKDREL